MRRFAVLAVFFMCALAGFARADELSIYPESGFYEDDIEVVISGEGVKYSLDGTLDVDEYTAPIAINAADEIRAYTVIAVNAGGERAYATYIVGLGAASAYDIPVAVLTTSDENLHDYETGILEKGAVWADYDDENPDSEIGEGKHPANYNQRGDEWVRGAHIALFDESGAEIASQLVGLSVSGAGSSKYAQKSLKVRADEEYDSENDEFELEGFFGYSGSARVYHTITEFNNIIFRNGGNDYVKTRIRWNVCAELARQSGFDIIAFPTPVMVFLNGEVYGFAQAQPSWSRKFIGDCVGIGDQENIEVVSAGDKAAYEAVGLTEIITADFESEENRQALENAVDVRQFIKYCAFEMLCGNTDWPSGNVKMWRYVGKYDENIPCTDGKWRFVIYDLDFAFNLHNTGDEIFDKLMTSTDSVRSLFRRMMEVDEYAAYYLTSLSVMLDNAFAGENISALIDEYDALAAKYLTDEKREGYVTAFRDSALTRGEIVRTKLAEYFGEPKPVYIEISGSDAFIGGVMVADGFSGVIYVSTSIEIVPASGAGREFTGFLVNGETASADTLFATRESGDMAIVIQTKAADECIVISGIAAKGDPDTVTVKNLGAEETSLSGMYISDDYSDPARFAMPEVTLAPGGEISFASTELGFGIKSGETVFIANDSGYIVDSLYVPRMSEFDEYALTGADEYRFFDRLAN